MKFGEFIKKIPLPSCINIFKMDPLRGYGLLVIDSRVVYLLVDHFFGGGAQTHVKIEGRDFTPIERRIIHKIILQVFADLQKAWSPVYHVNLQYQRTEINPQFASIVTPTEIIVQVVFELEIDGVTGNLQFCFPYSMLEPVRDKLAAGYQSDRDDVDQRWMQHFQEGLIGAPVRITVELGQGVLKVRDLLTLAVGDVLLLDKSSDEELEAMVEGNLKFRGRPGISRGNVSLQVTSVVRGEEGEKSHGTKRTGRDGGPVGGAVDDLRGREGADRIPRKAGRIHAA
jgi:flagellar motor switch protein FliM